MHPTGASLVHSTYLGGSGSDSAADIAVDSAGNAYVTGNSFSAGFPITPGVFDTSHNGGADTFVAKIGPPTVSAGGTVTVAVNEGALATHSGTFSDVSPANVILTASVGTVNKTGTDTWDWSYPTSDGPNQSQTVTITATDGNGETGSASFPLVVANVAPVVSSPTVSAEPSAEGSSVTAFATFSDPGADAPFTCTVNYGDGPGVLGLISGSTCSGPSHVYVHNGAYAVTVSVTDKDGAVGTQTSTHVVSNIAPAITSLTISAPAIDETGSVILSAVFTDPGFADTHAVIIDWRDGSSSTIPLTPGGRAFSVSHQYLDDKPTGTGSDIYNIAVSVSDNDGGVRDRSRTRYCRESRAGHRITDWTYESAVARSGRKYEPELYGYGHTGYTWVLVCLG